MSSLSVRCTAFTVAAALAVALPPLFVSRSQTRAARTNEHVSAAAALLAAALPDLLSAPLSQPAGDRDWLRELASQQWNVRWAGVFNADGEGYEFPRPTGVARTHILPQVDFTQTQTSFRPLADDPDLFLLTVPQQYGSGTLVAVMTPAAQTPAAAMAWIGYGISAALLVGLGAIFFASTLQPLSQLARAIRREQTVPLAVCNRLPSDWRAAARQLNELHNNLLHWRRQAGHIRHTMKERVDAQTRRVDAELRHCRTQADVDSLTGLLNRRALERALPGLFEHARNKRENLAALWLDVDHFKTLNDTLGHAAGDDLLAFIGELLRSVTRRGHDLVCRYGGDEFVVVLPAADAVAAADIAERVTKMLRQRVGALAVDPRPAISIGIATLDGDEPQDWTSLLERADQAMYAAKPARRSGIAAGALR